MADPLFVRDLSEEETEELKEARSAGSGVAARRARILLLSSQKRTSTEIADRVGCTPQTVRNAIHDFEEEGLESIRPKKPGPTEPDRIFEEFERANLLYLLNRDPQDFSRECSEWTLSLLAEVVCEVGLTDRIVSHETIRQAILETGYSWEEVKKGRSRPKESSSCAVLYRLLQETDGFVDVDD